MEDPWKSYIDAVINWVYNKGYHVDFVKNGEDSICEASKTIEINSALTSETQLIRLLHECGHVLVFENGSIFNFESKKYPKKSSGHKVFTVIEEIEAWKRGRELYLRLKIPLGDEIWEESMVKALKKYINWAAKNKGDVKDEN